MRKKDVKKEVKSLEFIPSSFHWRRVDKKDTKTACDILNSLTEEQMWAVKEYGDSRYDDGYDDGYPEEP